MYCGAWELALELFMIFFLQNFGRNELMQARTLTSQQVKRANEFHLEFVIEAANFVAWRMRMQVLLSGN